MKILVGLSGGVDSAVTAVLLKEQGHDVSGVTMSIWKEGYSCSSNHKVVHKNACLGPNEKEDIESAKNFASAIGIPYQVFDCSDNYEKIVLNHFKNEYMNARTPNPCVWCNSSMKFGVLPELAKQNGMEFDKFATGHYARVDFKDGRYILRRPYDLSKDQTYFLYRLKQEQLKNIILPLGEYKKEDVRKIAAKYNLAVHDKPDSQDFYEGDYNDLLKAEPKEGYIKDTDGKILATHQGFWNYSIGQRKGLGIAASEPLYVLSLDAQTNTVVVGYRDKTFKKSLVASTLNFVSYDYIPDKKLYAKIRSSQQPQEVSAKLQDGKLYVEFDEYQKSIAPGQSVVIYDDDILVAGGAIENAD